MALFKKKIKDDLVFEEGTDDKQSVVLKVVKHKLFIPVVAVVVLAILVKVLLGVLGGNETEMVYYDAMTSIFSNERGSFSYTLTVETGEKGTIIKENVPPPVESLEPDSDAEATTPGTSSGREFVDWEKYAEVKADYWQHPVYKVNITGTTMSLDPLQTNFTVTVATPYYNSKFTEVTVRDDTYWFDVETMYNWLSESSDVYLMSLKDSLPRGSKWLEIPASEFAVASRYAEAGDEQELSEAHSITTMYRRFLVSLQTAMNSVKNTLGDRGISKKEDVVSVQLVGDDAMSLVSIAKSIATRSGDFYDSCLSAAVEKGLYDDNQQKQAVREKDNFITAMSDLAMKLQMTNPRDLGIVASGQCRTYTNGYGNKQVEGVFGVQFSTDTTDYVLRLNAVRSGDQRDIVVPDGSKTTENSELYLNCFYDFVDYLNFTPIRTDVKLNINPDTIADGVLEKFITLVNSTGSYDKWLTFNNVGEFIIKYYTMSEADIANENDLKNTILVQDLVKALDKVVPEHATTAPVDLGVVEPPVTEPNNDDEQFQTIESQWLGEGVEVTFTHDEETSNHNLFVMNVDILNKTDADVVIKPADFVGHDLLDSTYPANIETLIRGYDSTFDMSLLLEEVTVPAKGWNQFKLYFVIAEDSGHVDLYHGEEQLGAMIQY